MRMAEKKFDHSLVWLAPNGTKSGRWRDTNGTESGQQKGSMDQCTLGAAGTALKNITVTLDNLRT
jgi:hypothetical protein